MSEITATENDLNFFLTLKQSELNNVVAGMMALMADSEGKYEAMKSQNWFKRMILTVIKKNKATIEDIRANNEKLSAYCAKALSVFVERQRVSESLILNLGTQINLIYSSHVGLKHELYGIATKLNEKIESVDSYHLLSQELGLKRFGRCVTDIYRILALLDKRMIDDPRKMANIRESLNKRKILSKKLVSAKAYLSDVCETHEDHVGIVYMEILAHTESRIAQMTGAMLERWNLVD